MKDRHMGKENNIMENNELRDCDSMDDLFGKLVGHIDKARAQISKTVDYEMVKAYWLIGHDIVENEQSGEYRAEYGKAVLKNLSKRLSVHYGSGFGIRTLERARKFYFMYQGITFDEKTSTMLTKFNEEAFATNLSWSHYLELISVTRDTARAFYELEASKNNWNVRELRRQIDSFLYDRLLQSDNKDRELLLACKGQEVNTPQDAIKNPLVLEFLNVPQPRNLSESDLEKALINNLQTFLLELGKGFAFIARQKRLSFSNKHFYADLVFYHVILKCYIIVDLKTNELSHADLGQMQLYVNYFDMEVKQENDNPTVGLVLCTDKSDEMVKYQLGEKAKQIFASTYQFHLPTEKELEKELKREIKAIKHDLAIKKGSNDEG